MEAAHALTATARGWDKAGIQSSGDYQRIRSLPVRTDADYPPNLVAEMTRLLRTPGGTETLFEAQARALYDLGEWGHGFYPICVGGGKTLLSFLAPQVVQAKRPALLLPAGLIEKTDREWKKAAKNWKVAKHLRFYSYEILGRVSGAQKLDLFKPDLIIADEAHKLKSERAAVTRRIARYMQQNPKTIFVPMSGTIMKSSIKDFAHLMLWSHNETSVLPHYTDNLVEWSEALDENANALTRRAPGVLLNLMPPISEDANAVDDRARARRVFFRRASATKGIIISGAQDAYAGSLQITGNEYTVSSATEQNFKTLRETMCRPDGWALSDAVQAWRVARELALGVHYSWDPLPPQEWLDARKVWAQFVRDFLGSAASRRQQIDSEFQVLNAVLNGDVADPDDALGTWRAIRPTFTVNSVPVWHDDSALLQAQRWLTAHPRGICWVEHRFFGNRLAQMTGLPYFGPRGRDAKDHFIQDATGPIIASVAANSTGRNLQSQWSDNLITAPAADSERWEQLIGRTHRNGQTADEVTVDVLVGCREHLQSIPRALASSDVKKDLLGFEQKLRIADVTWPDTFQVRAGFRWV